MRFLPIPLILVFSVAFSQTSNTTSSLQVKWTTDPFEGKVFIENKGQFGLTPACPADRLNPSPNGEGLNKISDALILFGTINDGVKIYFTSRGLIYNYFKAKMPDEEAEPENEKEEEKRLPKIETCQVGMEWLGANVNTQIIAEAGVTNYYTYPDPKDPSGRSSIRANAFKKITYKELYPGIDVEYTFPSPSPLERDGVRPLERPGIKYAFILHPGADVSLIKMKYTGADNLFFDDEKNIQITAPLGNIIDHAPSSYYAEDSSRNISSSFALNKNIVSFHLNNYDRKKIVVIDPWTKTGSAIFNPGGGTNNAYDVDYDFNGNVYVYGDQDYWVPFQLSKFNSAGVKQWTYAAFGQGSFYGDFAVDRNTGTSYIIDGVRLGLGSQVLKVNSLGSQVGMYPGIPDMDEMWRIVFDNCNHRAVIGLGNTSAAYQACMLDTNMASMTPINLLNSSSLYHDISLLTSDNNGSCYMLSAKPLTNDDEDNVILKVPLPTLLPVTYKVPSGHNFVEIGISFFSGYQRNGFNGMAVNSSFLYTYDGAVLKKWDAATGTLKGTKNVSSVPFSWGGLAADGCDNVYAGSQSSVKLYDASLNLKSSTPLTGTVADVVLDVGKKSLYACGKGFVSSLKVSAPSCFTVTANVCGGGNGGGAVAKVQGNGPYSYSWNPGGQTTPEVSGLTAGAYTVTVTRSGCNGIEESGSSAIVIPAVSPITFTENKTADCEQTCVDLNNTTPNTDSCWWSFSDGYIADSCYVSYCFSSPADYTASLTVKDNKGCTASEQLTISPESCTALYVPDSFTPNNDGINDIFLSYGAAITQFEIWIFDRWGNLIFKSNNIANGWNGNTKGDPSQQDIYVWQINYRGAEKEATKLTVRVALIR